MRAGLDSDLSRHHKGNAVQTTRNPGYYHLWHLHFPARPKIAAHAALVGFFRHLMCEKSPLSFLRGQSYTYGCQVERPWLDRFGTVTVSNRLSHANCSGAWIILYIVQSERGFSLVRMSAHPRTANRSLSISRDGVANAHPSFILRSPVLTSQRGRLRARARREDHRGGVDDQGNTNG